MTDRLQELTPMPKKNPNVGFIGNHTRMMVKHQTYSGETTMMKTLTAIVFGLLLFAVTSAQAAVIGTDSFDYPDGSVVSQAGGSGWDWDNIAKTHTGTTSNWNDAWGVHSVTNGAFVSNGGGAFREYNGPSEGADEGPPEADERIGAFRGEGTVYYGVTMTPVENGGWFGISGYDFGAERVFFGSPWQTGEFGVEVSGGDKALSGIPVVWGQTYRLVAALDFDGDQLLLWVDPDGNDFDNGGGDNSADAMVAYTAGNWNSAVRLASGATTEWDDLTATTTLEEAVPEPATLALLSLGGLAVLRRKK